MNTYLKLTSFKNDKQNCNCISPFYIDNITGLNPNTGRNYSSEDKDILKTSLYRISNAKGCKVGVCCDPKDPTSNPDPSFTSKFIKAYPKIMPIYDRSNLVSIKLSTNANVGGAGWVKPKPYMICKITKAVIKDTADPTIKLATNLVNDCFTNQCSNVETITVDTLLQNSKVDMEYTYIDDARVTQAILENNMSYVKEYIKKYKVVDSPLTNDNYNNRMIHIATQNKKTDILSMLIALKANINIKNTVNETPIYFAVRSQNLDAMDILLGQGADLSFFNVNGETAMFIAMKTGNIRIVKMLYNNNSPIIGVDNEGNNLLHYCIKNCPATKISNDALDNSKSNNDIYDDSDKIDIIKFLIERGINTEQTNKAGITALELTKKEINKEINKECSTTIEQENDDVKEYFFDIKPQNKNANANGNTNANANGNTNETANVNKNKYGAKSIKDEMSRYTKDHKQLLEIQTLLFNNIIRNNPKKYDGYISVDDIPKGAPIDVLDTVCVGTNMTGNEDTDECVAKGGQIVKIKNRTTKIKLELIPEEETKIDQVDETELYFKKNPIKIPKGTQPIDIQNYNNSLSNQVPQTTGMTYNIGETSSNIIGNLGSSLGFNPQPTKSIIKPAAPPAAPAQPASEASKIDPNIMTGDQPFDFAKDADFIRKCERDAIRNSEKLIITRPQTTLPQINISETITSFITKYKTLLIVLGIGLLLLIIGIIVYHYMYSETE